MISDRPMTEEEWARERATIDVTPEARERATIDVTPKSEDGLRFFLLARR